jgi:hypothetical protein
MPYLVQYLILSCLLVGADGGDEKAGIARPLREGSVHIRTATEPEQVLRRALDGPEPVLDVLGDVAPKVGDFRQVDVWVVRKGVNGKPEILPVDWVGMHERGHRDSNYILEHGDRLFVQSRLK